MSNMRTQVEETLEVIRPALQADGGDIELKDVDEETGIVSVTLVGACGTCPASTQTLDQVRDTIIESLDRKKKNEVIQQYITALQEKAAITYGTSAQ